MIRLLKNLLRDGLGVKPLYYVADAPTHVAFSSEIKALEKLGVVQPSLDHSSIDNYLTINGAPARVRRSKVSES